ncbi:MAG: hypothetical protein K0Q55_997 [Verrucomicrobia bacterium]|nr:hypothetical protein [Verrucomicrobiota bacterium]
MMTTSARAEHEGHDHRDDSAGPYHAREFVFEGFGSASVGRATIDNISANRIKNDARLGAGIGMSYYITRCFGVGADAYVENTAHAFVDNVSTSAIFRIPIGTSGFAPYIYGGGGHEFDLTKQWFAHLGTGMEYRFSSAFGIFTDARYVLVDKTSNYGVVRLGFRTSF